jgi:hypothetical protein
MRGTFADQGGLFSYISPEARVPRAEHAKLASVDTFVAWVRTVR